MAYYISALELDDYRVTYRWRKHEKTWDSVVGPKRFVSQETERKWVETAISLHERGEVLRFAVREMNSDKLVGILGVTNIDNHNRSFSTASMMDPEERGKGIIGKAREMVFRYMFDEMGMERVWVRVLEDNVSSRRSVEKFGYVQEGVMRKAAWKKGRFKDLIVYALLKEEFYNLYGKPDAGDPA